MGVVVLERERFLRGLRERWRERGRRRWRRRR